MTKIKFEGAVTKIRFEAAPKNMGPVTVDSGYGPVTLHRSNEKPLRAGEIGKGDTVIFDWVTGEVYNILKDDTEA